MNFSFELVDVKCNSVLSTKDSDWGKRDGIKIYYLAFTGSGHRSLMISGGDYPGTPDDQHVFTPGKKLVLRDFPPSNAPNWVTPQMNVRETDNIWVAIIGINEGLASIQGGGGSGSETASTWIVEFLQYIAGMVKDMEEVPIGSAMNVGYANLNYILGQINTTKNCQGVAFAHEMVFSVPYLVEKLINIKQRSTTIVIGRETAEQGLSIINVPKKSPDCGRPDYEVTLKMNLHLEPNVSVTDVINSKWSGLMTRFTPRTNLCVTPNMIAVWPVFYNRTISLLPNFNFSIIKMIWKIEDVEIYENFGTLRLNKEVVFPASDKRVIKDVTIDFEISSVGGINKIKLKTHGDDGNYLLNISILLKYYDDQSPKVVYEEEIYVNGQDVYGNPAYYDYLSCLENFRKTVFKYVKHQNRLHPRTPIESVLKFERDVIRIARASQDIYLRNDGNDG